MAPPRNSARSVAIAATSLTAHIARTIGHGELLAAHLGKVASGDDAELGRQRLEQHGDHVGQQHHPEQGVAVSRAGLDVGGEVAGVHVGDRGDHRRTGEQQQERSPIRPLPSASRIARVVRSLMACRLAMSLTAAILYADVP